MSLTHITDPKITTNPGIGFARARKLVSSSANLQRNEVYLRLREIDNASTDVQSSKVYGTRRGSR